MSGTTRKHTPLAVALRVTGTLAASAVFLGTAGTAAHAALPIPGQDAPAGGALSAAGAAVAPKGLTVPEQVQAPEAPADEPESAPAEPQRGDAADGKVDAPREAKKGTAQDAIAKARSQVGIRENGSGNTKFSSWYAGTDRAKETVDRDGGHINAYKKAAWCSMFVSWVGEELGMQKDFGSDAWTVQHAKYFQKQDRWGTKPKPGAVVFFNWKGSKSVSSIVHVGMVVKDNGNGTVKTIEGNTDNAVKERTRKTSQIVGYGYPEYAK
ncbi:CHAP domain-containing protein [Actinomadura flavalba]|uniref:CHAP domain-containing protein n=1 Tax=Actinomadura flavalba TaxID=1120938 RepID=UPI0003698A6E|nr:CHAP domain-containing protein [Actinomadura flavalba]